jgi:DNA-directed RNA polymerase subunit RPC12/RpoP
MFLYQCMSCGQEWTQGDEADKTTQCPSCHSVDRFMTNRNEIGRGGYVESEETDAPQGRSGMGTWDTWSRSESK